MNFKERKRLWLARNEFLVYFRASWVLGGGDEYDNKFVVNALLPKESQLSQVTQMTVGVTCGRAEHFVKINQAVIPNNITWEGIPLKWEGFTFV